MFITQSKPYAYNIYDEDEWANKSSDASELFLHIGDNLKTNNLDQGTREAMIIDFIHKHMVITNAITQ